MSPIISLSTHQSSTHRRIAPLHAITDAYTLADINTTWASGVNKTVLQAVAVEKVEIPQFSVYGYWIARTVSRTSTGALL